MSSPSAGSAEPQRNATSSAPAPEPKQRDAERTRAELLDVATTVFAEEGYSGARVDQIARKTRTTKRMIYYYFGSKERLYIAVLARAYRGIRETEQARGLEALPPVPAIRELAMATFDHHVNHPDFIRLVAIENIHRGALLKQASGLREAAHPAVDVLGQILNRGREEGVFRADVDALDVHLLISAYCVFQVANQYTFSHLFDLDLAAPEQREHFRAMLADVVVAWLRG